MRPAARGTEEMFGYVEIGMNTPTHHLRMHTRALYCLPHYIRSPGCSCMLAYQMSLGRTLLWSTCVTLVCRSCLCLSLLVCTYSLMSVTLVLSLIVCHSCLSRIVCHSCLSRIVLSPFQEPRHSERRCIPAHTVRENGVLWSHCRRPCGVRGVVL